MNLLTELEVEVDGTLGGPEAEGVHHVVAVSGDGAVVRHGKHHLREHHRR